MIKIMKISRLKRVQVKVVCPDWEATINTAIASGISMFDIDCLDSISVLCSVDILDLKELKAIVARNGGELLLVQHDRLHAVIYAAQRRCLLILAVFVIIVLTAWLPTRVLFVIVDGNHEIPTNLILEKAEKSGIVFGAPRHLVRSEAIKNRILSELPQLRWVGVNTKGCVAVISVAEKDALGSKRELTNVSNIIASCDGVVQELTVYSGTPLCEPGQVVRKGQILVSGYTDCGLVIRAEGANAEIVARTKHSLTTVSPMEWLSRGDIIKTKRRYSIQVGKKSIKLFKDSGISGPLCVRMCYNKIWSLPGGFILPISIQIEELQYADISHIMMDQRMEWLRIASDKYVNSIMLSGKILKAAYMQKTQNGLSIQNAVYDCIEIIGRVKTEEGLGFNGE